MSLSFVGVINRRCDHLLLKNVPGCSDSESA
jgi:hypothetical protein